VVAPRPPRLFSPPSRPLVGAAGGSGGNSRCPSRFTGTPPSPGSGPRARDPELRVRDFPCSRWVFFFGRLLPAGGAELVLILCALIGLVV
jgi:hypothetical protein